jgi:hypothetical protein
MILRQFLHADPLRSHTCSAAAGMPPVPSLTPLGTSNHTNFPRPTIEKENGMSDGLPVDPRARLGYDDAVVARMPDSAIEAFAGVGNPFRRAS